MPNPMTHKYFARDVLKDNCKKSYNSIKNDLETYELFSYGFDPFFAYQQFHKSEPLGDLGHNVKDFMNFF